LNEKVRIRELEQAANEAICVDCARPAESHRDQRTHLDILRDLKRIAALRVGGLSDPGSDRALRPAAWSMRTNGGIRTEPGEDPPASSST